MELVNYPWSGKVERTVSHQQPILDGGGSPVTDWHIIRTSVNEGVNSNSTSLLGSNLSRLVGVLLKVVSRVQPNRRRDGDAIARAQTGFGLFFSHAWPTGLVLRSQRP